MSDQHSRLTFGDERSVGINVRRLGSGEFASLLGGLGRAIELGQVEPDSPYVVAMIARRVRELSPRDGLPQGRVRGEPEREGRWLEQRRDFRLEWLRCVAFDGALESLLCSPEIRSILGLPGLEQPAGVRDLHDDDERGSFFGPLVRALEESSAVRPVGFGALRSA